jgi:hypothetical protein
MEAIQTASTSLFQGQMSNISDEHFHADMLSTALKSRFTLSAC